MWPIFLSHLFFLFVVVHAQNNDEGSFIVPPATGAIHDYSRNPIYHWGQQLDLRWNCSWSTIDLLLWQNDNPDPEPLLQNQPNTGSLSWQLTTLKNYTSSSSSNGTVFFLLVADSDSDDAFGSHYFNITGPLQSTNPTSIPSSLPSPQSTPSSQSTVSQNTSSPSPSSSSSSTGTSSPINSAALAAGLGVGLGITISALIGSLVFIFIRRRNRRRAGAGDDNMRQNDEIPTRGFGYWVNHRQNGPAHPPREIMGRRDTIEFFRNAVRVHEMEDDIGVRRISGMFEMPAKAFGDEEGDDEERTERGVVITTTEEAMDEEEGEGGDGNGDESGESRRTDAPGLQVATNETRRSSTVAPAEEVNEDSKGTNAQAHSVWTRKLSVKRQE